MSFSFEKPGLFKRICAYLLDLMIINFVGLMLSLPLHVFIQGYLFFIYFLFRDCIRGQSPGKMLTGLKVVTEDGSNPSVGQAVKRNLLLIIPLFPIIEFIVFLRDKDAGRRLGDRWAGTRVNDLHPERQDLPFLWVNILMLVVLILSSTVVIIVFSNYFQALKQP